jgi:CheY-like chemotaxis protein/anti-sigma regulatory factor (Ser/Thr protein kinase)
MATQADTRLLSSSTAPPVVKRGAGLDGPHTDDGVDQLKGHFLASLNHELRTPLSGVVGMTDLLLETALDLEQREYVETTRQCALQLLDTLNVVLAYSSLAAGQLKSERSEFHVRQVLESAAQTARSKCTDKGLEFRFQVDDSFAETIHGDAHHFREVFSHLLANAVKFTQRGWVEFRVFREADAKVRGQLCVQVRDTGIGIASDQLTRIFDSFQQIESGLDRQYAGLGLGLALVDKLVRLMGGTIEVESHVGFGSTFTVRLPMELTAIESAAILAQELADEQTAAGAPVAPVRQRAGRILVIEDNVIAQQVVRHILTRSGYELDVAATGDEALSMAATVPYALIIADIQLPGMDGFETVEELRKLPGLAHVPVIGLSANDSPETRNQSERNGFTEFMPKPLDRRVLLETIQRIAGPSS